MTRRIKFKVWSKANRKMTINSYNMILSGNGILFRGSYNDRMPLAEDKYILMQSTGLRDKSNEEIYEGDIIKWVSEFTDASKRNHVDTMKWEHDLSCFLLMPSCHEPYNAFMEIIGNVHENPELLKDSE